MSRFIDRLKQVSQGAPQHIGFRRAPAALEKPKIQLVARLAEGDIDSLADYTGGADAALLPVSRASSGRETLKRISEAMAEVPWGGWLGDIAPGKVRQIVRQGCDFVVFPAAGTPLTMAGGDEAGKILQVEASLSEGLLRAVNELPVDAVLVTSEEKGKDPLTWYELMLFQRLATLLTKPLLVSVPPGVSAGELQALWEAGVDGVVVEAGTGVVQGLRQTIDGLTFPIPRKREKREALLPRAGGESGVVAETEEEEFQ